MNPSRICNLPIFSIPKSRTYFNTSSSLPNPPTDIRDTMTHLGIDFLHEWEGESKTYIWYEDEHVKIFTRQHSSLYIQDICITDKDIDYTTTLATPSALGQTGSYMGHIYLSVALFDGDYNSGYGRIQNPTLVCYLVGTNYLSGYWESYGRLVPTNGYSGNELKLHLRKVYNALCKTLKNENYANGGDATHIAFTNGTLKDIVNGQLKNQLIMASSGGGGGQISGHAYDGCDGKGTSTSHDMLQSYVNSSGGGFGVVKSNQIVSKSAGPSSISLKNYTLNDLNVLPNEYQLGGYGGGSYIGNTLLFSKTMIGYNVETSSDEHTKTESVDIYSETPESGIPKAGNGHARITLIYDGWMGEETTIAYSGDDNTLTVQKSGNNIVFTFYSEETSIYSFNSYYGSSVRDIENIYIGFLIDSNQEVMKPSFIYETSDEVYAFNQEEPTDAQMSALYNWIAPGLPS